MLPAFVKIVLVVFSFLYFYFTLIEHFTVYGLNADSLKTGLHGLTHIKQKLI